MTANVLLDGLAERQEPVGDVSAVIVIRPPAVSDPSREDADERLGDALPLAGEEAEAAAPIGPP